VLLATGSYTYEAWIKLDGSKQSPAILAACTAADACVALVTIRNDLQQVTFGAQNSGGALLKAYATFGSSLNPDDNQWHHVAGCRSISGSAVTLNLFWDGQLVGTVTGTAAQIGSPSDLYLGSTEYAPTDGLGGYIDEVRVSNTIRYTGSFTPQTRFTTDANTEVLLHFDSFTGSTFVDSSSNGFAGSLAGSAAGAAICEQ
jgi:hypothetical protein